MFDLIPNLIASVLTVLLPVFASYKALRTNDPAQLQPWLMYWVSFALFVLFENYTYWVLGWLPLYGTVRLLFLLYLVLPQTQGARLAYQQYIEPFLADHEARIEDAIGDTYVKLQPYGIDHLGQLVEMIKTYILRMAPTPPRSSHGGGSGGRHAVPASAGSSTTYGGYAQSILGMFSMPAAREGAVIATAPAGDFGSLLSTATNILGRAGIGSGGSGGAPNVAAQADELARSGSLIPAHIRSPSEKARYINQQRDKLRVVLRALDYEADDTGNGNDNDELSRNRSEVSFDRISDDELDDRGAAPRRSGGGWFGFGGDDERPAEREREHERHDRGHDRHDRHGDRQHDRHERHGHSSGHDLAY